MPASIRSVIKAITEHTVISQYFPLLIRPVKENSICEIVIVAPVDVIRPV